ncbi:MAG: 2-succinyl-5-enolpyruvyl-6-hydroxy-3-cyclohexene-1-carboxylic-acid synthase [Cyclobacteriaceae bacterium]|nr:2-succinyl-5-enolpyruvyl-6-hydroxy-3-cyclohexene-1-carboxylic-acid synthase [Cyclobacteriaceae bacterium]
MNENILYHLVELCALKGIRHAVLCPGSRSAPFTIAFARNKKIKCLTISDERSAAFIALGIAQENDFPVVLVCTSGSAAYNFSPAVAEAFFQQIPLIVITADRPKEWIDQLDGQTIRQKELYGAHVKKYYELPQDYLHTDSEWHANRILNEAINFSQSGLKGPVQINAPFHEPLYPSDASKITTKEVRIIDSLIPSPTLSQKDWKLIEEQLLNKKVLIVSGQNSSDKELCETLTKFHDSYHLPIVGDILSNLHPLPFFCGHTDTFLAALSEDEKKQIQPDVLITFGKSLISKNLKLFLRKFQPKQHWHIQESGDVADTFQCLTRIIPLSPISFFNSLTKMNVSKVDPDFEKKWLNAEDRIRIKIKNFFEQKHDGEFQLVKKILESLPSCNLHLANSMTIRYANHIGLTNIKTDVNVFSNRGTSGIDGCSSTAVGHAIAKDIPNVLITGDLAFFYDRNAFWHNYALPNLFVIVLNNEGGIIFNLIDGPSSLPEKDEFFITQQKLNAKSLASEFGFSYDGPTVDMKDFFKSNGKVRILEIISSQSINKEIFEDFKKQLK